MKKNVEKKDQKLKLNKVTVIKLDAAKMHMLWGGAAMNDPAGSGRPQCDTRDSAVKDTL